MHSCWTKLQRSTKNRYFQPERTYFSLSIRLLLSMTMLLSRSGSTAFLNFANKNCRSNFCLIHRGNDYDMNHKRFFSRSDSDDDDIEDQVPPPLLLAEGLFAVDKPIDWTSSDVVSYIRGILERDARSRGIKPDKVGSDKRRSRVTTKKKIIKCGHGGTLDPLATGVLVIGVGQGTKHLQEYVHYCVLKLFPSCCIKSICICI